MQPRVLKNPRPEESVARNACRLQPGEIAPPPC